MKKGNRTKTFNIGEYSYYGRWKLVINFSKRLIYVYGIDWNTQFVNENRNFTFDEDIQLREYLISVSTHYYGTTMMEWVNKNIYEMV